MSSFLKFLGKLSCSSIFAGLAHILIILPTIASVSTQNTDRDWRSSANISIRGLTTAVPQTLDMSAWFKTGVAYINTTNLGNIEKKTKTIKFKPDSNIWRRNIAAGRYFIFYSVEGQSGVHFASCDPRKIFVSGMAILNQNDQEVQNNHLDQHIINARYFSNNLTQADTYEIEKTQSRKLEKLLGISLSQFGSTHSEASLLLYLKKILPSMMDKISERAQGKRTMIIGTTLQLLTLMDPCDDHCIRMLNIFPNVSKNFLNKAISKCGRSQVIKVDDVLENLVLIAGVKPHMASRNNMIKHNDPIELNFQQRSNRVISLMIEDAAPLAQ